LSRRPNAIVHRPNAIIPQAERDYPQAERDYPQAEPRLSGERPLIILRMAFHRPTGQAIDSANPGSPADYSSVCALAMPG
jgi:hypothetical protein